MKTITLPADTEHLYLDEVAHLIADHRNPEGPNDPDGVMYALDKIQATNEVHQAATDGLLKIRHPGTHGPFPIALGIERAVVLVPDVVAYLADYGMPVVVESQSAPVVAEQAGGDAKPLQRSAAQDALILKTIAALQHDPRALPRNPPGKPGVKAAVRAALSTDRLFAGSTVFDKAWERLCASGDIVTK